jgi:hypothetical protein
MVAPGFSSLSLFLSAGTISDFLLAFSEAKVAREARREVAKRPLPRP